jgi:hypothetical protein
VGSGIEHAYVGPREFRHECRQPPGDVRTEPVVPVRRIPASDDGQHAASAGYAVRNRATRRRWSAMSESISAGMQKRANC